MADKTSKWKTTMLEKISKDLGREANDQDLREFMQNLAKRNKGIKNPNKGFGSMDKERHADVSSKGGKAERKR